MQPVGKESSPKKMNNEWGDNIRVVTDDIITQLTRFHGSSNQHDNLALSRLTVSIAQMVQLQESIILSLQTQLSHQASVGRGTERRLSQLERLCALSGANGANGVVANHVPLAESQEGMAGGMSQAPRLRQARQKCRLEDRQEDRQPSAEQPDESDPNATNSEVGCNKKEEALSSMLFLNQPTRNATRKRRSPEPEPDALAPQEEKAAAPIAEPNAEENAKPNAQTRPMITNVPPLPTIDDVEKELLQVRKRRRQTEKRPPPPPCAKCRVRKRADMMRQAGRVNEDVFERWVRRPGACLAFMHMDEPGEAPSPLSFAETETQPPQVLK